MGDVSKYIMVAMPPKNMDYSVRLNDWPMDEKIGSKRIIRGATNPFIIDGLNRVDIMLQRRQNDTHIHPTGSIEVMLSKNKTPFFHQGLAATGEENEQFPLRTTQTFSSDTNHGLWSWQKASKLILDAPTKQAINTYMQNIYHAQVTGNPAEYAAIYSIYYQENAVADGGTREEGLALAQEDGLKNKASLDKLQPLQLEHAVYTLYAEGRVVNVTNPDGSSLIRSVPDKDGIVTEYRAYIALVESRWALVR